MFNVGDEVICIDDSAWRGDPFELRKGQVFTVKASYGKGGSVNEYKLLVDVISIGIEWCHIKRWMSVAGINMPHADFWPAERFRKVEKKRDRSELYAMFGIDGMIDQHAGVAA